ncbi:MAG TPA: hypothetical protein PKO06_12095 [Candidatus Ozemobacteraceae bacterium]|nr:hypothetical protein [Candidatus Ozemobacteraceae bacterium]
MTLRLVIFLLMTGLLGQLAHAAGPAHQRDPQLSARECKMLLRPERFADRSAGVRELLKLVREACSISGLVFITANDTEAESVRFVSFLDTPKFDLYKRGYVLRHRQDALVDRYGKCRVATKKYELTFKFRHPEPTVAIEQDTTPHSGFQGKESFEENLLVKETVIDRVYDRSGKVELKNKLGKKISDFSPIFPGLGKVGLSGSEEIVRVNELEIEEYQRDLGTIELGTRATGKAVVSVWYRRGEAKPLIAEFSFKTRLLSRDRLHSLINHTYRTSETLLRELQKAGSTWIAVGTTKTGLVYQMSQPNQD